MLIDSHCHLDLLDLEACGGDLDAVLAQAAGEGVSGFLCISVTPEHFPRVRGLAERYPAVWASAGVHPSQKLASEPDEETLIAMADHPRVIAVGETGLDYHYNQGDLDWQRERFRRHVRAARAVGKPLVIHSRAARADTLRILDEEGARDVGGVMHCFAEDWDTARAAMDLGFLISFSGIVTFRNADALREVAARVPPDAMLVETDAPWLTPVPHRGRTNQPAYVRHVAERIAQLHETSLEDVATTTTANFFRLFTGAQLSG